jgi:hypothetical protein
VAAAQVLRGPVEQWADAQRGRIRELREMTATLQYGA